MAQLELFSSHITRKNDWTCYRTTWDLSVFNYIARQTAENLPIPLVQKKAG